MLRSFSSLQKARPLLPGRSTLSTTSAGRQKRASSAASSAEPASLIAYSSAASVVRSRSLSRGRRRPGGFAVGRSARWSLRAGRSGSRSGSSCVASISQAPRPKSTAMTAEVVTQAPRATRPKQPADPCALLACYEQGRGPQERRTQASFALCESSAQRALTAEPHSRDALCNEPAPARLFNVTSIQKQKSSGGPSRTLSRAAFLREKGNGPRPPASTTIRRAGTVAALPPRGGALRSDAKQYRRAAAGRVRRRPRRGRR